MAATNKIPKQITYTKETSKTSLWRDPNIETRIRELFLQGITGTRIAITLGVSKNAVLRRLHLWGLRHQPTAAGTNIASRRGRTASIWADTANIQKLIALRQEGRSAAYIARALGVSKNAVIGKIHRIKKKQNTTEPILSHTYKGKANSAAASARPSFWADPARVERLKDLWQAGVSTRRIAEILGTTQRAVRHKVEHLGLPRRAAPLPSSRHRHDLTPSPADHPSPPTPSETFDPSSSDATLPTVVRGTGCRWPLWGDHEEPTHRYCGKPTIPLWPGVYCAECRAKALSRSSISREHETVQ